MESEQKFERQLEYLNSAIDGLMLTKEEKKEAVAAEQRTKIKELKKAQKKADEEAHLRIAKFFSPAGRLPPGSDAACHLDVT